MFKLCNICDSLYKPKPKQTVSSEILFGKVVISQQDNIFFIDPSEIIYMKSDNSYTNFYLRDGRQLLVSKSLAKVQKDFTSSVFIRVNQSFLINKNYINCIDKKKRQLVLNENYKVPFTISLKVLLSLLTDINSRSVELQNMNTI